MYLFIQNNDIFQNSTRTFALIHSFNYKTLQPFSNKVVYVVLGVISNAEILVSHMIISLFY